MTTIVRYSRTPLLREFAAQFATKFGTEYQIIASEGESTVQFGVRNLQCSGSDWSYGIFRYAESWRDRNDYPVAWNQTTFTQMVEDFMAEAQEGE